MIGLWNYANIYFMKQEFVITEVDGLKIVRDDLFPGGTKRRAFLGLVNGISESEFVYAADYYGYAAYAIALVAMDIGKKVKLFYPSPKRDTDIFIKATSLPNVSYEVVENAQTQVEASVFAKGYASENDARFFPIGLDFPEFGEELKKVVEQAEIEAPEIWCMGGSGTLGRALQRAYPHIPVNIVSVGTSNFNGGTNTVYNAPETLDDEAEIKPPYPSCGHYDAKVWRFVLQNAKPGSYIWNVAP